MIKVVTRSLNYKLLILSYKNPMITVETRNCNYTLINNI